MLSTWKNDASPAAKHTFAGALQPSGLRMTLCCETRRYRVPPTHCSTAPSPTCSPHPLSPSRQQIAPNCCHRAGEGQHSEGRAVIGTHPVQSCRGQPQWRGSGEAPCLRSTVTFAHPSIPSTVCKQWSHSWDRSLKIKSRHKLQVQTQELTYGMITL